MWLRTLRTDCVRVSYRIHGLLIYSSTVKTFTQHKHTFTIVCLQHFTKLSSPVMMSYQSEGTVTLFILYWIYTEHEEQEEASSRNCTARWYGSVLGAPVLLHVHVEALLSECTKTCFQHDSFRKLQISDCCYSKIKNISNRVCKCSNGIEERLYDLIQVRLRVKSIFSFRDYTSCVCICSSRQ